MKAPRLVALACATALIPLGAALPAGAASPDKVWEISFDGYCDGLTMNIPSAGLGTKTTVDGVQSGCEDANPIYGQTAPGKKKKYGAKKGSEYVTIPTYNIFTVIRKNKTFSMYTDNGGLISETLTGTWTLGPPAADAARSAVQTAAANTGSASDVVGPAGTLELTFDGYCDGLSLNTPSQGTGVKGTVDGRFIGCASDTVMGAYGKLGGVKKTYGVQSGGGFLHTAVFKDHTWIHYSYSGPMIMVLNSGTWTEGPPALASGLASSTGR